MIRRRDRSRSAGPLGGAIAVAMLAACAAAAFARAPIDSVNEAMATWKGRMAREAIGLWGMPDTMLREGTLMMMTWKADNRADLPPEQRADPKATPSGAQAWATRCTRVLGVDDREVVRSARWFGDHCSTDPADYAPPGVATRSPAAAVAAAPKPAAPAPAAPAASTVAPSANAPAAMAEIPFTLEGALIVVDVEFSPGHTLPFAFDSGLSHGNLVTTEAAKALGLKGTESVGIGDSGGALRSAMLAKVPAVRIGGARLENQLFAIVDIPESVTQRSDEKLPRLAGFLGAPLMTGAVLCLDFGHQRMQRWPRAKFDRAGRTSIPMKTVHELPTVGVRIDDQPATLVVDSGNNGAATVFVSYAAQHDFRKRYPGLVQSSSDDGGGVRRPALAAEAGVLEIGPGAAFQHAPLMVIPQGLDPSWGIDGLLGFTVLSELDPCLDRDGQSLMYESQ